jgi:hypothetical protein
LLCLKTAVLLAQKLLFSKQPQFNVFVFMLFTTICCVFSEGSQYMQAGLLCPV